MRIWSSIVLIFLCLFCKSQSTNTIIPSSSILNKVKVGDSIVYYQCHVEEGTQQLYTASGQTLTGNAQKYSITEKYVITKGVDNYMVNYYSSSLTIFPNRRFSALKIREKKYWEFRKEKSFVLSSEALTALIALERKGREAMEYDYPITKYTTNQLIIKYGKDFKQLVIDGNYVLSKWLLK
jgi:hypothetical protein